MDDAIDQMNQTAKSILLYDVREFEPQMQDMSAIIVEAARITAEAMTLLRSLGNNSNRLHGLTECLVQIEGHADDIHDAGLKAQYPRCAGDFPMELVVRRDILHQLQQVVDRFERSEVRRVGKEWVSSCRFW